MRLQKYLADCGVASRRKCEELILEGKVTVNGKVVQVLGTQVTDEDEVRYENRILKSASKYVYYILNKPVGYITSVQDEKNRPTVMELMKEVPERIFPVGRLDYNTSGLLILTNDGALTYGLTHPKHHVNKTYEVQIKGQIKESALQKLREGIVIDGKKTHPAEVKVMQSSENKSIIRLTIHEGRNRQVRKMCEQVGHPVLKLKRIAIGNIALKHLKEGEYRCLTEQEIDYLKQISIQLTKLNEKYSYIRN